jgi:hypothetical protein
LNELKADVSQKKELFIIYKGADRILMYSGSPVVRALGYKPEGRGFETR